MNVKCVNGQYQPAIRVRFYYTLVSLLLFEKVVKTLKRRDIYCGTEG